MNTTPTQLPVSKLPDADMQAVPSALARAAQRARELAARTGTPLIVVENGKLVEELVPTNEDDHRLVHIIKKHIR
ncbi:hypothetical protein [Rhodoferax sp.]|uniref:hypothetical protein n=1 Tax=Rhodoferax sp. TaxID=50421 RepID=UPI00277398F0|nr:hypothetical protein [Rhodoferax sp.]